MTDKLAFLGPGSSPGQAPAGEAELAPEAPAPEPVQEAGEDARAPEQPAAERPRDERGRFAAAEPPPTGADAPTTSPMKGEEEAASPAQPLSEKEVVGFHKAMMAEREKRQALEKQLRDLQARVPADQPAPSQPDALQAALFAQTRTISRRFAEQHYGKEAVAELHDWAVARCDADPAFNQLMLSSEDPYEAAKQARDKETIVSKVTPDRLAAFEAWEAAQKADGDVRAPAPSPQPAAARPPPPRSLATASGTGDAGRPHVPQHEGAAYERLFNR